MQNWWWSFVALALAASCMDSSTDVSAVQQLPVLWQEGLEKHHAQLPCRGRALADDAWSVEDHAQILLQYMRPGAKRFLKDVRIVNRSADAIKWQWTKVLSKIVTAAPAHVTWPESALPPAAAPDYGAMRSRLDACSYELRHEVHEGLVCLHAEAPPNSRAKAPWQIEEDGLLLAEHAANKSLRDINLALRSQHAIRQRFCRLRKKLPVITCAFYHARCDPEAPYQPLDYDIWEPVNASGAIPPDAQIDWFKGVMRAPAEWQLHLDVACFVLHDPKSGDRIQLDDTDEFLLEDVHPDMTIGALLDRVRQWMGKSASPGAAHGFDLDDLGVALRPDADADSPGPSAEPDCKYAVGDRVLFRCRDGQHRRATVHAADVRAKPARYIISVDAHNTCRNVHASSLSASQPIVPPPSNASDDAPSPPMASAAALPPAFQRHQCVWYDGPEADAPCRVWIESADDDGMYRVILQGEDRETKACQLSKDPNSSSAPQISAQDPASTTASPPW